MKTVLTALLIAIHCLGYSQNELTPFLPPIDSFYGEINLSDTINPLYCSVWENGDYKIYIETAPFKTRLQIEYLSLVDMAKNTDKSDTTTLRRLNMYIDRYLIAVNQMKEAQSGFDLKQLIVYIGPNNIELNKGNSSYIETYVRQSLERGQAAVYYKGQRIFKLRTRVLADYIMSTINIYYDDDKNYCFNYIGYLNW